MYTMLHVKCDCRKKKRALDKFGKSGYFKYTLVDKQGVSIVLLMIVKSWGGQLSSVFIQFSSMFNLPNIGPKCTWAVK